MGSTVAPSSWAAPGEEGHPMVEVVVDVIKGAGHLPLVVVRDHQMGGLFPQVIVVDHQRGGSSPCFSILITKFWI